jgi:hypothetical protein
VAGVQRLSQLTGKMEAITLQCRYDTGYTFELSGGTGDLLKYQTDRKFARVE